MESNRKYIQRNKLFPNQKVHNIPCRCPTNKKNKRNTSKSKIFWTTYNDNTYQCEYNSTEDMNKKLNVLLLSCKSTYSQTNIDM